MNIYYRQVDDPVLGAFIYSLQQSSDVGALFPFY